MDTKQSSSNSGTMTDMNAERINLTEIIEDMFLVLTSKEKEVIIKRFSLDNKPKQTLEKIGQSFSVTRERIRQIEKIALGKLRRTVDNSKLSLINKIAKSILAFEHSHASKDSRGNISWHFIILFLVGRKARKTMRYDVRIRSLPWHR